MKRSIWLRALQVLVLLIGIADVADAQATWQWDRPQRVTVRGYQGTLMEPFLSRDGKLLFFNNSNAPGVNTDLFYAERVNDVIFQYRGPLDGANSPALDGVASLDSSGNLYFVSTRSYPATLSTVYRGKYRNGRVTQVEIVPGISQKIPGHVNFDVEISADGSTLYYVESIFSGGQPATAKLAIAHKQGEGFVHDPDSDAILKTVNSGRLTYAACISRDQLTLIYTQVSPTHPVPALFLASRSTLRAPFGPPKPVSEATGFVEAATFGPDDHSIYYHRREGDGYVLYLLRRK